MYVLLVKRIEGGIGTTSLWLSQEFTSYEKAKQAALFFSANGGVKYEIIEK